MKQNGNQIKKVNKKDTVASEKIIHTKKKNYCTFLQKHLVIYKKSSNFAVDFEFQSDYFQKTTENDKQHPIRSIKVSMGT